jgi:hypothetical protein
MHKFHHRPHSFSGRWVKPDAQTPLSRR